MGKKAGAAENIQVLVRCRPLSDKEKSNGQNSCVDMDLANRCVVLKNSGLEQDRYTFDAVINNTFSQKDIFTQFIQPLVECVLEGFNATVFAYGQSGSGKTHTMSGVMKDPELEGVIPRSISHIFSALKATKESDPNKTYSLSATFVELYNGKVRDLLAKQQVPLDVRENKDHTFFVQGAVAPAVKGPEEIFKLMEQGMDRRCTAATELNADSSRSHSLFTISLVCTDNTENGPISVASKLNLVDLAGSERQGKTSAAGDTLQEGCNINLSLSALGTVIDTIVKGRGHVPFRSSQLTMLLKDSLGGNSKTVMFANINPSEHNLSETVSTLRFADRAKKIKNKPVVNIDSKDQKLAEMNDQLQEMKDKLSKFESGGAGALEKELEQLRLKEDELKVALDNSLQVREGDALDHGQTVEKLKEELKATKMRITQLEESVLKLKDELEIAEAKVMEVKTQAKEILQICTTYLRAEKHFINGDDLEGHLRQLTAEDGPLGSGSKGEKNAKEVAVLENRIQTLTVENENLKSEVMRKDCEMQDRVNLCRKELEKAETRNAKLEQELQESKENANAVAERAVEAITNAAKERNGEDAQDVVLRGLPSRMLTKISAEEMKALQEALASYDKKQLVNTDEFKKADAAMEDVQRGHLDIQNSVAQELSALKKHLASRAVEGTGKDAEAVNALQELLKESDRTATALMAEVTAQNRLLGNMRNVMKKTGLVPLSLVKGNKQAAEASLDVMVTTDEKVNDAQNQLLVRLTENLNRAQNQRNRLLQAVCKGGENAALKGEVEQLVKENSKLQEEKFNELRKMKRYLAKAREFTVQCVMLDGAVPAENAVDGSVSMKGSRAGMSRRGSLFSSRRGSIGGNSRSFGPSSGDVSVASKSDRMGVEHSVASGNEQARSSIENNSVSRVREVDGSSNPPNSEPSLNSGSELKLVREANAKLEKRLAQVEARALKSKEDGTTARSALREMRSEFERMDLELKESRTVNTTLNETKEKLFKELERQLHEVNQEKIKNAEIMGKLKEMTSAFEQMSRQKKREGDELSDMDSRLQQRSEQLDQFGTLLDKQKVFIEEGNKKLFSVQEKLREAEVEKEETKAHYEKLLVEKDENMQRVVNQRIAEYAERVGKGKGDRHNEISKLQKRMKKMKDFIANLEEQLDMKVIECEDTKRVLQEEKISHLKHIIRDKSSQQVAVQDESERIQSALDKAKQERQRQSEMFKGKQSTQTVGTGRAQRRNSRRTSVRSSRRGSRRSSLKYSIDGNA